MSSIVYLYGLPHNDEYAAVMMNEEMFVLHMCVNCIYSYTPPYMVVVL